MKRFDREKDPYPYSSIYIFNISIGILFSSMDYPFIIMISPFKKIIILVLWMAVAALFVIISHELFDLPDEVAGGFYFIAIGISVSSVLNYYRKREQT